MRMIELPEWVVVAAVVTWLLTILGWSYANRTANDREARKEYRAALNSLEADVDRLLSVYLTYLTKDSAVENEQARISIHFELNRLHRHVESLQCDVGSNLADQYANLFEVITGGDFESKSRKLINAGRDHARAVTMAESLMNCAELWFRKVYLPNRKLRNQVTKFFFSTNK